jgi:hypothetical protein
MSEDPADTEPQWTTTAFTELTGNLGYARDLVRGGRYLERLEVGAFDVCGLYRAAWVHAVSALDHWVHRELYDRALGFALNVSVPRPSRFLKIEVPMSLFEDVQRQTKTLRDAFQSHLETEFGYQSFQSPENIKIALKYVSDVQLWPGVAKELNGHGGGRTSPEEIQSRLKEIVYRRNKIAHEADRDPDRHGAQQLITDHETTEVIDWVEQLAKAILAVLGPPPADIESEKRARRRWTRHEIDEATARLEDPGACTAVRRLLSHADDRGGQFQGGKGLEPAGGIYYPLFGKRRSLWSLYLYSNRPSITLNIATITPHDEELARRTINEIRRNTALDAALLQDDETLLSSYPAFGIHALANLPGAVETIIRALDMITGHSLALSS